MQRKVHHPPYLQVESSYKLPAIRSIYDFRSVQVFHLTYKAKTLRNWIHKVKTLGNWTCLLCLVNPWRTWKRCHAPKAQCWHQTSEHNGYNKYYFFLS